jgi:hypothetical protein
MLSSLCLGTTVTSSISQRNATSDGTRPIGFGRAIVRSAYRIISLRRHENGRLPMRARNRNGGAAALKDLGSRLSSVQDRATEHGAFSGPCSPHIDQGVSALYFGTSPILPLEVVPTYLSPRSCIRIRKTRCQKG